MFSGLSRFLFFKTGTGIQDCPGFFLEPGIGIRGRTGTGVRSDLIGVLKKIFLISVGVPVYRLVADRRRCCSSRPAAPAGHLRRGEFIRKCHLSFAGSAALSI
jgi:hypothetical protein